MSLEYTPTTATVRSAFVLARAAHDEEIAPVVAEFNRWLEGVVMEAFERGFEMADKTRRTQDPS